MYSTHEPSAGHLARLEAISGSAEVAVARNEDDAARLAPLTDVILGHRYLRQCIGETSRLKWVQSTAGGVDRLPLDAIRERAVVLTRCTVMSSVIARHACTMAWAIARRIPEMVQRHANRDWADGAAWPPLPQRAVVFGTGSIGNEIARLLQHDGIDVTGINRSGRPPKAPHFFDRVLDIEGSTMSLQDTQWCFLALPLTRATRHVFDREKLDALPTDAVLVNVGRGETLVTDDLVSALERDHLAGAGLDVVDAPPEHPIWTAPRVIISPHVAAHSRERADLTERYVEGQVKRFVSDEPLLDVVDLA
jgi:phosphoglycerate dehydrogenase-like enzyme